MHSFTLFILAALLLVAATQNSFNFKIISDSYTFLTNNHNAQQLIGSLNQLSKIICFAGCSQLSQCVLVIFQNSTCQMYNSDVVLVIGSSSNELWVKNNRSVQVFNNSDKSLTSYWPVMGQSPTDFISGQDLTSTSPTYGVDQYGVSGGTIFVNSSTTYWKVPPAVYFYGDFTVILWINPKRCNLVNSRILDFGSGTPLDNVVLAFTDQHNTCTMFSQVNTGNVQTWSFMSSSVLTTNQWTHVAFTACGNEMSIYKSGVKQSSTGSFTVRPVIRNSSFFGLGNWADPPSNAEFDEIKFYNRCLFSNEISYDKNYVKSLIYNITIF